MSDGIMAKAGGEGKGLCIFDLRFIIYDWGGGRAGRPGLRISDCGMRNEGARRGRVIADSAVLTFLPFLRSCLPAFCSVCSVVEQSVVGCQSPGLAGAESGWMVDAMDREDTIEIVVNEQQRRFCAG